MEKELSYVCFKFLCLACLVVRQFCTNECVEWTFPLETGLCIQNCRAFGGIFEYVAYLVTSNNDVMVMPMSALSQKKCHFGRVVRI